MADNYNTQDAIDWLFGSDEQGMTIRRSSWDEGRYWIYDPIYETLRNISHSRTSDAVVSKSDWKANDWDLNWVGRTS